VRTILGVRADHYDFDVTSDLPANSGTADDSLVTPKINLIYSMSEATEIYFSAGRGYHSNDARGTTITVDPATGDRAERVDPLVDADEVELGFRTFLASRLNVSAALWRLDLDSELLFVGDAGNTEASRPSRRYGIEVPLYFRPNDQWTFDLEVAFTHSEFADDDPAGEEIPGSIDRVIAAGVTANLTNGVYGSLRARYFGQRPLIEDGTVESASSTVWNASVGIRRGSFEVRLDVLNLFDSEDEDITYFYASRLPSEPSEGVDDIHLHPMEPRTARVHLNWRF
jgi:outer membrane receptor protein involved in Fe transport